MLNSYYHMADQIFVMKNAEEKMKEALLKFVKQQLNKPDEFFLANRING